MKTILLLSIFVLLSLMLTVPVHADKIILQDGSVLNGTIIDPESDPVVIKIPGGKVRINRDALTEIFIDESSTVAEKNQEEVPLQVQSYSTSDKDKNNKQELDEEEVIRFNAYMDRIIPSEHADEDLSISPERQKDFYRVVAMGTKVTPLLEHKLAKSSGNGQAIALRAIDAIDSNKGENLARNLAGKHANSEVREESLRILAKSSSEKNAAVFQTALNDTQGNVRAAAIESIGKGKDPKQVPNLVAALDDPVPSVRDAAEKALTKTVPNQKFKTSKEWRKWAESKYDSVPKSYQEPVNTSTKLTFGDS